MSDYRRYDDVKIGDTFPPEPAVYHVTAEAIETYRSISQCSLIVSEEDAQPADFVPPMLAAVYIRGSQNALKAPPGGIHAKQGFTFLAEIKDGDMLSTVLTVVEKYERKGRRYVVSETETTNASGIVVTRGRITSVWGQEQ
jgi:hypothetical protein